MEHMNDHSNKGRVEMVPDKGYALSGKIMLSAIVVLFVVVVFMVALHLYARWYLLRQRRRQLERRRQRRASRSSQVLVMADGLARQVVPVDRGLDVTVLNSLPVFLYSPSKEEQPKPPPSTECAVCLSEFEDKEIVRLLPKCNHSFHIECIDMWFHSHSTCPLCRSPVEKVVVKSAEKAISWDSGCSLPPPPLSPQPPLVDRRKALELGVRIINVPPRIQPESEFCLSSPGNRFLALKRILSMGRKSPAAGCGSTTPRGAGTSRVAATELDLENGLGESSPGVVQAAT